MSVIIKKLAFILGVGIALCGTVVAQTPDRPTPEEIARRDALAARVDGCLIFDSNRSGTFGIYSIALNGRRVRTLRDGNSHEQFPDVLPGGNSLLYSLGNSPERNANADVWVLEGETPRRVARNGTFPSFSSDGLKVFFERNRSRVMEAAVGGGQEREIFPRTSTAFNGYEIVKPRVSPDGRFVSFTSDKLGQWNAWYANLDTLEAFHVGYGCQPIWNSTSNFLAYVTLSGVQGATGLMRYSRSDATTQTLLDLGPPRGQEYFPRFNGAQDRILTYAASTDYDHSHTTGNYQLYVRIQEEQPVRITFDRYTNRWPFLVSTATGLCPDPSATCEDPLRDTDLDGRPDCSDECPTDPQKIVAGVCGCGVSDQDSDHNGQVDCLESPVVTPTPTETPTAADPQIQRYSQLVSTTEALLPRLTKRTTRAQRRMRTELKSLLTEMQSLRGAMQSSLGTESVAFDKSVARGLRTLKAIIKDKGTRLRRLKVIAQSRFGQVEMLLE